MPWSCLRVFLRVVCGDRCVLAVCFAACVSRGVDAAVAAAAGGAGETRMDRGCAHMPQSELRGERGGGRHERWCVRRVCTHFFHIQNTSGKNTSEKGRASIFLIGGPPIARSRRSEGKRQCKKKEEKRRRLQ